MWHDIWHGFLHALQDSLISFAIIFVIYVIIELVENKLSNKLQKAKKFSPVFGALYGLIPQCGFSVVATDMFVKRHITIGTLLAIYIATSDEALPILLSSPDKILSVIPLLILKFVLAFCVGYLVDFIYTKSRRQVHEHEHDCRHEETTHSGCCHHEIEGDKKSAKEILLHPLLHSLKLLAYIFVINLIFSITIELVGEDVITATLLKAKYVSPLLTTALGLIPNCASSIIISNLYLAGGIGFGACLAGLVCNAGLGIMFLLKDNKNKKETFTIILILIGVALIAGYSLSLILGFK